VKGGKQEAQMKTMRQWLAKHEKQDELHLRSNASLTNASLTNTSLTNTTYGKNI
jgi:hypothetical protein